jgi:DNA-binding MarR family transcriptional regulator
MTRRSRPTAEARLPADPAADPGAAARIESVGFLMADVTRLMRKGFDRRVKDLGLTRPQWRVLVYVLQNEGLSQAALARAMDIERAPLGQLVRALESMRLVKRERSAADQREWLIFGDEASRALMPSLLDAATWLRGVCLQGVSRADEHVLRRTLQRIRSNLSYELER